MLLMPLRIEQVILNQGEQSIKAMFQKMVELSWEQQAKEIGDASFASNS